MPRHRIVELSPQYALGSFAGEPIVVTRYGRTPVWFPVSKMQEAAASRALARLWRTEVQAWLASLANRNAPIDLREAALRAMQAWQDGATNEVAPRAAPSQAR